MSEQTIYLLCVWTEDQASDEETSPLRAVLEDPRTGKRWGFSEPEALAVFLERMVNGEWRMANSEWRMVNGEW